MKERRGKVLGENKSNSLKFKIEISVKKKQDFGDFGVFRKGSKIQERCQILQFIATKLKRTIPTKKKLSTKLNEIFIIRNIFSVHFSQKLFVI